MTDRVILAVKYTPVGAGVHVRRAVGGFLRYVQHRDLHPITPPSPKARQVSGLVKYVAYRDRAGTRAELFGPTGTLGSAERKAFASFVVAAVEGSRPQLYRGRDGELRDRRRAVYRMVISPERADGLDIRRLTQAAVGRLERECGTSGLSWIAAIHRNTAHHHVHLVLAGMRADGAGGFARVDITRARLAAMKDALREEIERQRADRTLCPQPVENRARPAGVTPRPKPGTSALTFAARSLMPARQRQAARPVYVAHHGQAVVALRALARRYQRQMQYELEQSYRQSRLELVA